MMRPRLYLQPTPTETRLFLTCGEEEVLRSVLPAPTGCHPRAAPTVCEGLALWLGSPLSVVLCAADEERLCALGLSDGLGLGTKTMHYDVEVIDPRRRRTRLRSFRDLQQLALRGVR